jgi:hypothetical protein
LEAYFYHRTFGGFVIPLLLRASVMGTAIRVMMMAKSGMYHV